MSDTATIDVPGIGRTKSIYVYTAGALTLGVIGYAWWSRRNQAPAQDPTALLSDPALSQDSGGTTTPGIVTSIDTSTPDPNSLPPTTNEQWAQRATEILTTTLGYDAQTVGLALGLYLSRQALTADQANIVRVAWGQLGRPPIGDFPILTTGGGTPSPPPSSDRPPNSSPPPAVTPPPPPQHTELHDTVAPGFHVDQWIEDENKRLPDLGYPKVSYDQLVAWNPDLPSNIVWRAPTRDYPGTRNNVFRTWKTYRIG